MSANQQKWQEDQDEDQGKWQDQDEHEGIWRGPEEIGGENDRSQAREQHNSFDPPGHCAKESKSKPKPKPKPVQKATTGAAGGQGGGHGLPKLHTRKQVSIA